VFTGIAANTRGSLSSFSLNTGHACIRVRTTINFARRDQQVARIVRSTSVANRQRQVTCQLYVRFHFVHLLSHTHAHLISLFFPLSNCVFCLFPSACAPCLAPCNPKALLSQEASASDSFFFERLPHYATPKLPGDILVATTSEVHLTRHDSQSTSSRTSRQIERAVTNPAHFQTRTARISVNAKKI
jgi:hypothetical protein